MAFKIHPCERGFNVLYRCLDMIENTLAGHEFFIADDLTGADIMMSFPLEASLSRARISADQHPNIVAFVNNIQARPAYLTALEKGGPYIFGPGTP